MSALTLVVTDAGRAALVNAENTGTAPVLVGAFGVTDQAFTAKATTATLPGEIKRLTTFAGDAVAADTIHVTVRDDSADAYTIRGFAFYLDDGTLFASYSQTDAIGEKSAQSMFLLALDAIFASISATSLSFGDTDFLLSAATTERQGIVELATDAETTTGTDAQRAVTPHGFKAALDGRFGAGAPSTFVKSLLTAAAAATFRAALAIKGAALYDAGSGNGLDADLLDGQHGSYYRAWANLTGVPTSFPPSSHTHAAGDITSGTFPVARGGTGRATLTSGSFLVGNGTGAVTLRTAAQVLTDIGAAKASHTHTWSQILDPPATATRWPTWTEVTSKPSFGTASGKDVDYFATAAQGAKADSAMQPSNAVADGTLAIDGPAATARVFYLLSGGSKRWTLYANTTAESGSNAGSDLTIARYDDTGNSIGSWLIVNRATGAATISGDVAVTGSITALNLGTASSKNVGEFATAAQGAKADSAAATIAALSPAEAAAVSNWNTAAGTTGAKFLGATSGTPNAPGSGTYVGLNMPYTSGNIGCQIAGRVTTGAAELWFRGVSGGTPSSWAQVFTYAGGTLSGGIGAPSFTSTSDPRLKDSLQRVADTRNVDGIDLWSWKWKAGTRRAGQPETGVRSDEVRGVFPGCVHVDEHGFDAVDYGRLGTHLGVLAHRRARELEQALAAAATRIDRLEHRLAALERRS